MGNMENTDKIRQLLSGFNPDEYPDGQDVSFFIANNPLITKKILKIASLPDTVAYYYNYTTDEFCECAIDCEGIERWIDSGNDEKVLSIGLQADTPSPIFLNFSTGFLCSCSIVTFGSQYVVLYSFEHCDYFAIYLDFDKNSPEYSASMAVLDLEKEAGFFDNKDADSIETEFGDICERVARWLKKHNNTVSSLVFTIDEDGKVRVDTTMSSIIKET